MRNQYPRGNRITIGLFSLLYLLMLVYGTLFPLSGWVAPTGGFFQYFLEADLSNLSTTDLITNVLVYIPAGLLWASFLARRIRWPAAVVLASVMGLGVSFSLEATQVFLPARNSALSDLILNWLGALIGGAAALLMSEHTGLGVRLRSFRSETFAAGALANIGLIVLALWALSQLSPLVPSLAISNLRDGVKPVWLTLTGQSPFIVAQALVYFCSVIALGGIFVSASRSRLVGLVLFALILTTILLWKIPVLSRQLSLEALLGCAGAMIVLALLHRVPSRWLVACAGCFLLAGFMLDGLRESDLSTQTFAFNWIPFKGHMQNIVGLANILASGWVFLGLGYVAHYLCRPSKAVLVAVTGALLVALLAALVEIQQLGIPGRVPDVTDVVIAVVAWSCAWVGSRTRSINSMLKPSGSDSGPIIAKRRS